jgi:hypothetical protein
LEIVWSDEKNCKCVVKTLCGERFVLFCFRKSSLDITNRLVKCRQGKQALYTHRALLQGAVLQDWMPYDVARCYTPDIGDEIIQLRPCL